jgi:hypothetical protein
MCTPAISILGTGCARRIALMTRSPVIGVPSRRQNTRSDCRSTLKEP